MELIFFIILVVFLVLPVFFATRKQRQRQKEIAAFQASVTPGKRVVTAGGIHGTVTAVREGDIDLEVACGVVVTVDKMGILRAAETASHPVGDASAKPQQAQPAAGNGLEPAQPEVDGDAANSQPTDLRAEERPGELEDHKQGDSDDKEVGK